jgi:hypothetical protein
MSFSGSGNDFLKVIGMTFAGPDFLGEALDVLAAVRKNVLSLDIGFSIQRICFHQLHCIRASKSMARIQMRKSLNRMSQLETQRAA